ncbi:hypothetical protein ABZ470_09705 [Streptosporangium sp. NPDC020072]|uniref:hypothetical protein n=1 Tax=Streptosporangium sp. NPDC020072 TaxID=3154788 RepID=UPI003442D7AE
MWGFIDFVKVYGLVPLDAILGVPEKRYGDHFDDVGMPMGLMSLIVRALLGVALAVAVNQILNNGVWSPLWTVISVVLAVLLALIPEQTPENTPETPRNKPLEKVFFIVNSESSTNARLGLFLLTALIFTFLSSFIPTGIIGNAEGKASSMPPSMPSPTPKASPGSPSESQRRKIPSPPRADPCRLVDAVRLGRFGKTEIDPAYGNFDRCDVLIYPPGEDEVDVKVEFDPGPLPEQTTSSETMKNVIVMKEPAQSTECERRMAFSADNDTIVSVTAKRGEKGRTSLCDIADTAAEIAAEKLGAGELEKYPRSLPQDSLANEDACALLSPDTLGEFVPGVDAANPYVGYGNWTCKWSSTTGDLRVNLHFDQGRQPDSTDGAPTRLNGYRAFVERWADDERACLTQVVYRSYPDRYGRTKAETLQLLVDGSFPMDRLCRVSTELAYSATAQLRGAA